MSDKSAWDIEGIEQSESMKRIGRSPMLKDYLLMGNAGNWPVLPVLAVCLAVFAVQFVSGFQSLFDHSRSPDSAFAFTGNAMDEGRYYTLLTSMFMHASILHIWSNMAAYLGTAPLVIARFGKGLRGLIPFHIFYLMCGLAGTLMFWLIHPHGSVPMVGASGAIYGVVGALMRLDVTEARLAPVFSKTTLKAFWFLIYSNIVVILVFGGPSILTQILEGKGQEVFVPIAWEAHMGGFVAGFVLIGLMAGRGWPGPWRAGMRVDPLDGVTA